MEPNTAQKTDTTQTATKPTIILEQKHTIDFSQTSFIVLDYRKKQDMLNQLHLAFEGLINPLFSFSHSVKPDEAAIPDIPAINDGEKELAKKMQELVEKKQTWPQLPQIIFLSLALAELYRNIEKAKKTSDPVIKKVNSICKRLSTGVLDKSVFEEVTEANRNQVIVSQKVLHEEEKERLKKEQEEKIRAEAEKKAQLEKEEKERIQQELKRKEQLRQLDVQMLYAQAAKSAIAYAESLQQHCNEFLSHHDQEYKQIAELDDIDALTKLKIAKEKSYQDLLQEKEQALAAVDLFRKNCQLNVTPEEEKAFEAARNPISELSKSFDVVNVRLAVCGKAITERINAIEHKKREALRIKAEEEEKKLAAILSTTKTENPTLVLSPLKAYRSESRETLKPEFSSVFHKASWRLFFLGGLCLIAGAIVAGVTLGAAAPIYAPLFAAGGGFIIAGAVQRKRENAPVEEAFRRLEEMFEVKDENKKHFTKTKNPSPQKLLANNPAVTSVNKTNKTNKPDLPVTVSSNPQNISLANNPNRLLKKPKESDNGDDAVKPGSWSDFRV